MVFRNYVGGLLQIVWNLAYLYECCRKQKEGNTRIPVKQKGYVLNVIQELEEAYKILSQLSNDEMYKENYDEIKSWHNHFEKKYDDKYFQIKPANLTVEDAKELEQDSFRWYENLISQFTNSATTLLTTEKYREEFNSLKQIVGKKVGQDLDAAFLCLGHGIATPSVMIMNRVAEFMVKKLYKKVIDRSPSDDATWGMLEHDLKLKMGEKDPIIGLLQHRRRKRNLSQHPGEQYTLKEAEQNFFQIQELIIEINKKLKKMNSKK